eukprot:TCONS_00047506-protein
MLYSMLPQSLKIALLAEFVLFPFGILLHALAVFVIHRTNEDAVFTEIQKIYLINLSLVEVLLSLTQMISKSFNFFSEMSGSSFEFIFELLHASFFSVWYMLIMVLISFDRFLVVYLNLRYPSLWTPKKAKIVVTLLPFLSLVITMVANFVIKNNHLMNDRSNTLTIYRMFPFIDMTCALIFFSAYGYLLHRLLYYRKFAVRCQVIRVDVLNHTSQMTNRSHSTVQNSTSGTSSDSASSTRPLKVNFFYPALLVISFILFWMVPNWIHYLYYKDDQKIPVSFHWAVDLCYPIAFILDAFIYIFSSKKIRNSLRRFLKRTRGYNTNS